MASVIRRPFLCVAAVVACAVVCCAGTVIVPAGDVDALTNALKTASAYDTVKLSAGTYDLSPLANAPMANANGDGYGAALLSLGVAGLHLMGATGDPKDVILEATDSECRLLLISYNSCKVSGLTLSGGNADAACSMGRSLCGIICGQWQSIFCILAFCLRQAHWRSRRRSCRRVCRRR